MTNVLSNNILIVDNKIQTYQNIGNYFKSVGYNVSYAINGIDAIEKIITETPDLALIDIDIEDISSQGVLEGLKKIQNSTPVVILADNPNMDTIIEFIRIGAKDFVVKPINIPGLEQKVRDILNTNKNHRESQLLSELVDLHSITSQLSSTKDNDQILDITFEACLKALNSSQGYLMLFDERELSLNLVRAVGEYHGSEMIHTNDESKDWVEARWAFKNNRTLTIIDGETYIEELKPYIKQVKGIMIIVPLRSSDEVVGVVCVEGIKDDLLHYQLEQSLLEILAAQAGVAIKNL